LAAWAAILIHDYCLTFVAEVERFWRVGQLNWASGFFYLNRYLTLFGHVPVMLEYFWTTSNPNKYEVSLFLSRTMIASVGGKILRYGLLDVRAYPPLCSGKRSEICFV
jgi:hypothetical protein